MLNQKVLPALALAAFLGMGAFVSTGANATVTITDSLSGGSGDVENILFNQSGLATGPALTVQGITNSTGTVIDFTSDENIQTPAIGQARIEGADGGYQFLFFETNLGDAFLKAQFNIDAIADGNVTITVFHNGGGPTVSVFSLDGNGENWFTIEGSLIPDMLITGIQIEATASIAVTFSDIAQFRIGGFGGEEPPCAPNCDQLPEPGTLALIGSGLISVAILRRRRKLVAH